MTIAALGYYGFGNLGDEAVLAGIRSALAQEPPFRGATVRVLSADGSATRRLHPGVETVDRWRLREVAAGLKGVDLFVLGGGSLLQDATSVRSVLWYAMVATLARRRAGRVLWWGQGIGPLRTTLARRVVGLLARGADAITVRDPGSAALLKEIGAPGSIEVVADPAFALSLDPSVPAPAGTLLCVRAWKDADLGRRLAAGEGMERAPGPIEALPMHLPVDGELLPVDRRRIDWSAGGDLATTLARFGAARLTVSMRLHGLIFSARCGTPFVALSYDPKVDALAEAAGQSDVCLPVAGLSPAQVADAIERALESAPQRRERLSEFARLQRELARRPAQRAAEWWP